MSVFVQKNFHFEIPTKCNILCSYSLRFDRADDDDDDDYDDDGDDYDDENLVDDCLIDEFKSARFDSFIPFFSRIYFFTQDLVISY